jgi:hypothetical protein
MRAALQMGAVTQKESFSITPFWPTIRAIEPDVWQAAWLQDVTSI